MEEPEIVVLSGGVSQEREVSRRSAKAVAAALGATFRRVDLIDVTEAEPPAGLNPARQVVFSALHGHFGEDGGMQKFLETAGVEFTGSGSEASALCMDKSRAKEAAATSGVRPAPGVLVPQGGRPDARSVAARLGDSLVVKPNSDGSSIGLHFVEGAEQLDNLWQNLEERAWLVESHLTGRELTLGLLDGRAMGVVEILPRSGVFDYQSKYTKGMTRYDYPARLPDRVTRAVQEAGEAAFRACGCRDFARADFILTDSGIPWFLEINTIPGLTETSLLPKSAACGGMDFPALAAALVAPALRRFELIRRKLAS